MKVFNLKPSTKVKPLMGSETGKHGETWAPGQILSHNLRRCLNDLVADLQRIVLMFGV